MVDERRQHERHKKAIRFQCYIDGHRFDTASLDISTGGAFLETDDDIRLGAVVMIVPVREMKKKVPVVLVGSVARHQESPAKGLGIKWLKCVTRNGIQQVFDFLAFYLDLFPSHLPLPAPGVAESEVVAFDFRSNLFYIPNIPAADAPSGRRGSKGPPPAPTATAAAGSSAASAPPVAKPANVTTSVRLTPQVADAAVGPASEDLSEKLVSPPNYKRDDAPGAVTTQLSGAMGRIPVQIPVQVFIHDHIFDGTIHYLGTTAVMVRFDPPPSGLDSATPLIALPIPVKSKRLVVYLNCSVRSVQSYRTASAVDVEFVIQKVEREAQPGLFERYVRFLFFKLVAQG